MYNIGDTLIYGENGVFIVSDIGCRDDVKGSSKGSVYYTLSPVFGKGNCFVPIDTTVYMRPVMSVEEANALIERIPSIEPAVCTDNRFNHIEAFYKGYFKQHTTDALVAIIKGLNMKLSEKNSRSVRGEITLKRARDLLFGELSVVLDLELNQVGSYVGLV